MRFIFDTLRRLYDWVLSFADRPSGPWVLFLVAFAESSFFPVPPDFLLIALAVARPGRALWFATITTVGSVLGAGLGYWIGYQFYEVIGHPIVAFYGQEDSYSRVQVLYQEWDAIAVGVAGFTPIPYKVFTIAAGAFHLDLTVFFLASVISRGARFFIVGALIMLFGERIREFIERYFDRLALVALALFVGGFLIVKYAIR